MKKLSLVCCLMSVISMAEIPDFGPVVPAGPQFRCNVNILQVYIDGKSYDLTTFTNWSSCLPKKDEAACEEARKLVQKKAFYCDNRLATNHKGQTLGATDKLPNGNYALYMNHQECVDDVKTLPDVQW